MNETTGSPLKNESRAVSREGRWLTIPNGLCAIRLVGSFALVPLAIYDRPSAFLITYLALAATDWVDGKLARRLNQESKLGPKLDSAADVTMYAALLFGAGWMFGTTLLGESLLIGAVVVSYAGSCLASVVKFRRLPSYHTRGAKISGFLILLAVIALFLAWSIWPLRIAAFFVTLTNLEATLITLALSERRDDVPTLYHALRKTPL